MKIDPHTHTNHSDGTDSPAELMRNARSAGLDIIGLTDHDGTSGWDEAAAEVPECGVGLLRGMEMSCVREGITVHLLSYLHDPDDADLIEACRKTIDSRENRAQAMVTRLSKDFPITWENVLRFAPDEGPIGRPHIADALVASGAFENRGACFEYVLHPSSKYYVRHWSPDPVEATEMIRAAGGVPVIAHPRARKRQKLLPLEVIEEMIEAGLAGVEVFHRDHSPEDRDFMLKWAKDRDMLITGSSDYHGDGKPNRLGENTTPFEVIQEIEAQGKLDLIMP